MGCIAGEESIEKRKKIDNLRLSAEEWKRVQTFETLLNVSTHTLLYCSFMLKETDFQQGPTSILLCHHSYTM
jgi:hypothetical protein